MAQADAELVERVARWCAEAGRQAGTEEIRRAIAPLSWDELIALRALLADPPPARPLGPLALADLARGAPPDVAAEREREGRYRAEEEPATPAITPSPPSRRGVRSAPRAPRAPGMLIRRARDAPSVPVRPPPVLPPIDELLLPEGRSTLERLVRAHGARRPALAAALGAGWRRDDGSPPGEHDLSRLLEHHGLTRAFERRERDETLHALRAAGGVRPVAAARLGLADPAALDAALARLGASAKAERIRDDRRAGLRGRATLSERVRLLLADDARLRDLGLIPEFEADLRARLPEHLRALRTAPGPLPLAFARSLSLVPAEARAVAMRFGLDLGRSSPRPRPTQAGPGRSAAAPGPAATPRPGAARPPGNARPRTSRPPGEARPRTPRPPGEARPRTRAPSGGGRPPPGRGRARGPRRG
jgi:hypothetical protein